MKAKYAQDAGALGLIISDSQGQCDHSFDQLCSEGADKGNGEGFGAQDAPELWKDIKIPTVLIRKHDSEVFMPSFLSKS